MNAMHAMSAPADSDPGTADSHEVDQLTEQTYREVEASGVPIRREESWYERMVREGRVRPAKHGWRMPTERWKVPEDFDLEDFLLGEREEDR